MKEASGELSMTAITVVAIAAIAGVFTAIIYPRIKANIVQQTTCSTKTNCGVCNGGQQQCQSYKEDGTLENITCPCD